MKFKEFLQCAHKLFTVYKVELDGSLSHKEHLNADELDTWMSNIYGKFTTVKVIEDNSKKEIIYTDNGREFVKT